MDSTQLQNLLMERAHTMPNKARRVAEYLLANMREASFRSIGDIAEELKVSKAQLVRVAQMLGFSGYAELKSTRLPFLQGQLAAETASLTAFTGRNMQTWMTLWHSCHRRILKNSVSLSGLQTLFTVLDGEFHHL